MAWKLGHNFFNTRHSLFKPNDISGKKILKEIKDNKYHIYIICKRKQYRFVSCDTTNLKYNTSTFYYLDQEQDKVFITQNHSKELELKKSKNIGTIIVVTDKGERELADFIIINEFFSIGNVKTAKGIKGTTPSDLEVMYIGQAFGRKERKKIDYRIVHHEKIQSIALDIITKGSNEDILVIGVCIETSSTAYLFSSKAAPAFSSATIGTLQNVQKNTAQRIAEAQEITLFEAGLIRYFRPKLNVTHKKSFPQADYGSYDEIYKTDFDHVSVALNVADIGVRLYSKYITKSAYRHFQHYDLKTIKQKHSLFEYLIKSS